ncbi:MAG TPA: hypothetical protein QGF58_07315 [Myxococcota bacterium]|nr:hypothetical protein [Myxococcota bacterium]
MLDISRTVSPLALIAEVRERPWDLWRPGYLVHQWGSRVRVLQLEDSEARARDVDLQRWSWQRSDRNVLADWLRALRDLTPARRTPDYAVAKAAREAAQTALARHDTAMAVDMIRGGLAAEGRDELLRVLEIRALYAHEELSRLEADFALKALPLVGRRARGMATQVKASLAPVVWRSAC